MSFGMIILNRSIATKQNDATRIKITFSYILRLKMIIKTLQMMLKKDLINQIMKSIDHYQR